MDTHDVSHVKEYWEQLNQEKKTLEHALAFKGLPPTWRKSKGDLIMKHLLMRQTSYLTEKIPGHYMLHASFVPPPYHPCASRMESLRKIMVTDLLLETHHRGSYVVLRTITPVHIMTGILVIVEDESDTPITLQIYHQETRSLADKFPKGTILVVKEPYLKVTADGEFGIRLDHHCDFKILQKYDSKVPSVWQERQFGNSFSRLSSNDWRLMGNRLFNNSKYYLAIECYSKALEYNLKDPERQIIQLNRALTFLKSHQFDAALSDTQEILALFPTSEKALFRKSQALYHLRKFRESCNTWKILRKAFPENVSARNEFTRALDRLLEQESGKFCFKKMQQEAKRLSPPQLDHATYIGPVSIKLTSNRGRGLFTTSQVKAGDLLLCEKAVGYAFFDEEKKSQGLSLLMNTETNSMTIGCQMELLTSVIQTLQKNPSFMPAILDLHHGSYKTLDVTWADGNPVVDTFLIETILALNSFGCTRSTRAHHIELALNRTTASDVFHSVGLWPIAAHGNHSCLANASRSFIGDIMIIRASQDLAPDTEIVFPYKNLFRDSEPNLDKALEQWGFQCDCALCEDLKATKPTNLAIRKRLMEKLAAVFQSPKTVSMGSIDTLLANLENTYARPALEVPRIDIYDCYAALSKIYYSCGYPEKAVGAVLKTLDSLGFAIEGGELPQKPGTSLVIKKWGLVKDDLIGCWMMLANIYHIWAPSLEASAQAYARLFYRICIGEDETFDQTYSLGSLRLDGFCARAE
ncbi:TPR domain protein [Penicillium macrosclerotiorum]|uniref:TPR domain protein n=1 Tax=Penicillium macrosclerotiorum TaxID=303699 RepID=UPI0025497F4C|nr:TPR domain protein [Penicillium macrosclerotiorum]KAJ5690204.1 TPR domain protein [Penicillium macrosclerotiorum]